MDLCLDRFDLMNQAVGLDRHERAAFSLQAAAAMGFDGDQRPARRKSRQERTPL
jgi:hypothetical protein